MGFLKDFFFLDLSDYENFGMSFPLGLFLILLTIGISSALFVINYNKMIMATALKKLLRHKATDELSAKTLSDLGLDGVKKLKHALSHSGQLSYIVKRVGAEEITYDEYLSKSKEKGFKEEKIDFSTEKFYISPDKIDRAKKILEEDNSSFTKPIVLTAVMVAVLILFAILAPDVLSAINSSLEAK